MRKLAFILALVGAAQPLLAQEQTEDGRTIIRITIYGDDSCPTGTGDEVVVCARRRNRSVIASRVRCGAIRPTRRSAAGPIARGRWTKPRRDG